jgi:chaperone BCS1
VKDFETFIDEKAIKWYFQHGIPYKRSYLFYGPPGSGKSSLIQALAAKYDRNLCFLQPTDASMTDDAFKTCIQTAPGNSFIVFEDIDALFNKDRTKKHTKCPLTFSGLLNGLDGVGNPDGQIFIMTTNYIDRLDSALIRSVRVDLHIEFPLALDEQLRNMFLLFYPNEHECSNEFVAEIRNHFKDGISMSAVQQHFIINMKAPPKVVVANVKFLGERLDVVTQYDKELKGDDSDAQSTDKKQDIKASMSSQVLLAFDQIKSSVVF